MQECMGTGELEAPLFSHPEEASRVSIPGQAHTSSEADSPPYATPDWAGCGGRLKASPEDFLVDEVPLYPPSGTGEHLYVRIWKRGLSTQGALRRLSSATGLPLRAMGWAGQKDAQAVTTQWISLLTGSEPDLSAAEGGTLRILDVARHGNKLRRGHLAGNRFTVSLRDARLPPGWPEVLAFFTRHGFPNLFGPQRFGPDGANASTGRRHLDRLRGARRISERERFLIHSYQAELFNRLIGRRIRQTGNLGRIVDGDLAILHRNGSSFLVTSEDVEEANARAGLNELSASAPLFGCRVALADGEPGTWERELLQREQLTLDAFRFGTKDASVSGERRAVRAFPQNLSWEYEPASNDSGTLKLSFLLGPGVYATSFLREVMKSPQADGPWATLGDA
jgi:tRNA pseudouridine13 synthase